MNLEFVARSAGPQNVLSSMSYCHTQEQNPRADIQVWSNEGLDTGEDGDSGEDKGRKRYFRALAMWLDDGEEGQMD